MNNDALTLDYLMEAIEEDVRKFSYEIAYQRNN